MTLTAETQTIIKNEILKGTRKHDIANLVHVSLATVYKFANGTYELIMTNKRKIQMRKTQSLIRRAIPRLKSHKMKVTSTKISEKIGKRLSPRSIRRHLRLMKYKYRKSAKTI